MEETKKKTGHKVEREFGLSTISLKNKTTVFVLLFIIVVAGLSSYLNMPREAFPEVVVPQIYVGTPYPGNSPLDIEKLVTRPLEKEINTITGIDRMTSTSVQGYSTIFIEFDFSVTPEEALRKVKDKVDIAMSDPEFPDDLPADPNVFELNISELTPIMNVNLSGDFSLDQLKEYAEYLEDRIEGIPEVTEVDIRGVQDKEMKVNVDLYKMQSNEISFMDIAGAINNENLTISAGNLLAGDMRRTVRVVGDIKNAEDLGDIIVKNEKQNIVYLKDIAEVIFEFEEAQSYAREYEKPVVMLDVKKRAGENLINAADQVSEIIADARENQFPPNLEMTITGDQSRQTRVQVSELENSIIFGMLLVILVLLFFLGLRNALFVGVAIPLSMFTSFFILSSVGVTLNMMVLFSLVLALGMLVDNGIVVVENVYRLLGEGYNHFDAARFGVGEVAWPIIASTATTLAAFIPLALWPGLMGEFMFWLPVTLMTVLGSSLFVALVINPVLVRQFMKLKENPTTIRKTMTTASLLIVAGIVISFGVTWLGTLLIIGGILGILNKLFLNPATEYFQQRVLPALERRYERFLQFALKWPRAFFAGTFGFLILSFVLLGVAQPKVVFFPDNFPNYANVFIEAPIGTDIEMVNDITKDLEHKLVDYAQQYVVQEEDDHGNTHEFNYLIESIIAQVGEGTSDPNEGPSMAQTPHKGRITISFVGFQDRRGVSTQKVLNDIRNLVSGVPGVQITVDKDPAGPPQKKPINIEVIGDDYDQVIAEAKSIKAFIDERKVPGIEELKLDVSLGKPEMPIIIDRAKARRFNLSTAQIGSTLRNSLYGLETSSYKSGEDDYKIMIRLKDEYRYDSEALMNQTVTFRDQMTGKIRQIPISSVAEANYESTFSAVKRKDLNRLITITSNVLNGYNENEVVEEIKANLEDYEIPEEIDVKFTGQQEDMAKEMAFLSTALLIAVFMIFLIMVTQFNSAATPFIIIASVVFSLIGVFLGLVIFNMEFVIIMTMIGIISLAGIVVNNAIVLIDYTKLIMQRKRNELGLEENAPLPIDAVFDSIVEGGKTRLRPVLLTAITTILGLVPLAIGLNIDFISFITSYQANFYIGGDNVIFWGPMSWTVIFGLTFATFLTLVIVPVMYYLKTQLAYRLKIG